MEQSSARVFRGPDDVERALNVLGLGFRPTKDVDVIGLAGTGGEGYCVSARPLPEVVVAAAHDVALALGLPTHWLNPGPTDLLQHGLPIGFESRVVRRAYGPRLSVSFAGRVDLVALKVFAAADQGPRSRHMQDLVALEPSVDELLMAADWTRQHDPSAAFAQELRALMRYLGVDMDSGESHA